MKSHLYFLIFLLTFFVFASTMFGSIHSKETFVEPPFSKDGRCGNGNGLAAPFQKCSPGSCCSIFGWCGAGDDHCRKYKRYDKIYDGGPAITETTNGRCGPEFNNTRCKPSECCSMFGWCGAGDDHCKKYKRSDILYNGPPIPETKDGRCGDGNGLKPPFQKCSQGGCCSVYGWCGNGQDHCKTYKRKDTIYDGTPIPVSKDGRCGDGNGLKPPFQKCTPGSCCSRFGWCGTGKDHCQTFKRKDAIYHG